MKTIIRVLCDYMSEIYDSKYFVRNDVLFIDTPKSMFKINLKDGERFGFYTLFHKNSKSQDSFHHTQTKRVMLTRVIFEAFSHDFYKYNNLFFEYNDYERVMKDVQIIIDHVYLKNKYIRYSILKCPICNRKLKVLNSKGDLRKDIYCKCKIEKHHTHLQYLYGKGYYLNVDGIKIGKV